MRQRTPDGSVTRHRGKWSARVRWTDENGKRREKRWVPQQNTKAAAKDLLPEVVADVLRDRTGAGPAIVTFKDLALDFVEAHCIPPVYENGRKLRGIQDWQGVKNTVLKILIPALGARPIAEVTFPEVLRLRDARLDAPIIRRGKTLAGKRSIARVNREMAPLSQIFARAVLLRIIDRNPCTEGGRANPLVNAAAEKRRKPHILTPAEERAMLLVYPIRTRDMFIVAIDTGLRENELRQLTGTMVDLKAGVLVLPWEITKDKQDRSIPLSRRAAKILATRMRLDGDGKMFAAKLHAIDEDFATACAGAGVQGFRWHDCRATFATRLWEAGVPEFEIALITGHRFEFDPASRRVGVLTGRAKVLRKHYIHLDRSFKKTAKIIDSFGSIEAVDVN